MNHATRVLVTLVGVFAMLGSACSDPGEEVTTTGSPGGRDDPLFVSIEVGGGFVPQGHDFRQPPRAVVYSDGQAFAPGAITLQYPGPAVLPVFRTKVTSAQLEEILAAAKEAGLTGEENDYGEPPVADAPYTTVTVVADGQTRVTSIYALDVTSGPESEGEEPSGAPEPDPFVTPEEAEARREAQEFVELVGSIIGHSGEGEYEPDRYRVLPLAVGGNEPTVAAGEGIEPQIKDWPFPHITLVANECVAVTGRDAATFREELRQANEITQWRTQSGELFTLAVRPVLPHEPDCPEEPEQESP